MNTTHIDVTMDFRNIGGQAIDLRVPAQQPVKELIENICQTLHIEQALAGRQAYCLRIVNKQKIICEDTILNDTCIGNGDVLELVL